MSDALDKLIALNTAYKWLNGAKKVAEATKLVQDSAKTVNDMARDVKKGGKTASVDWRKLEKLLGANGKELVKLNVYWTEQAADVQAAAAAGFSPIKNDAQSRITALMSLRETEGTDSPIFARALTKTADYVQGYRDKVADRASYCEMVAEKAEEMEKAYNEANEAIDDTFTLLGVAFIAFEPMSGAAAATAMKHMINIERTIRNRPKSVAKAYRALADAALSHARVQNAELARVDTALGDLRQMQGASFLKDAGEYLKGLFQAA